MTFNRIINMRFINFICMSAAAASTVSTSASSESEIVTTGAPSKTERFPVFFDEMNEVIAALAKVVEKNPDEVLEYVQRFAPFPGVIGV